MAKDRFAIPTLTKFAAPTETKTVDGIATATFRKDVLRVGEYTHPFDNWAEVFTAEDLDTFVAKFDEMKSNGIDVEVTVDHSWSARDVIGYVEGMEVDGDTLYATVQIKGQDNIDLVNVVKNVSIEVASRYKDSQAREYGRVIRAVSVVQSPVVSDQGEFIAASMPPGEGIGILTLSTGRTPKKRGGSDMDITKLLAILGSALGDDQITVENAETKIKEFSALNATNVKAKTDLEAELATARTELTAAKTALEAAKTTGGDGVIHNYSALSADRREIIDERAEQVEESIDALVGKRVLVDADLAKAMKSAFVGDTGARNVLMLSRSKDGKKPAAVEFIRLFSSHVVGDVRGGVVAPKRDEDGSKELDKVCEESRKLIEAMN